MKKYFKPERLTGARYSIQSDVWSFGLSLVELVIGRYPIPSPTRHEYAKIFNVQLEDIEMDDYGNEADEGNEDTSPKAMAIFELLDYIVNKVSFFNKFSIRVIIKVTK